MRAKKAAKLVGKALPPNTRLALRGANALRAFGRTVRRRWPWFAVAAVFAALMAGAALDAATTSVPIASADQAGRHGVPPQLWAAYQHTSRLWCHPATGTVWMAPANGEAHGRDFEGGWHRADWRLVAAMGKVESDHAAGRDINSFGDVSPWVIGPALDGSNSQYAVIADTDGGAWDLDISGDRAVGPMQILPATMARFGADANRDGMADPHNAWDAALTAARYLCLAGSDARTAIWAYNHSEEYAAAVMAEYLALVAEVGEDEALLLPDGLPLGHAAVPEGSPLGGAPPMMASVMTRWAALGGLSADVEPHCVRGRCAWVVDAAPEIIGAWEDALAGIEERGPIVAEAKILFAGDTARWAQLPELAAGTGLAWPVAVVPPPPASSPDIDGTVPGEAVAPKWWPYHLAPGDPAWTAASPVVVLSAVKGAVVGSPTDGSAAFGPVGCARIADGHGWVWVLCGIDPHGRQGGPIRAGHMIGVASGIEVAVELVAPDGHRACPAAVFDHWASGRLWAPEAIDDTHTARQAPAEPAEPTAEPPELAAGFPPELVAALTGPDGEQQQPDGDAEQGPELNPIRECEHE
ncbi:MAG: hypothetical protein OXI18_06700 [bacterium]|nr:hypothetical protein [bacterium]